MSKVSLPQSSTPDGWPKVSSPSRVGVRAAWRCHCALASSWKAGGLGAADPQIHGAAQKTHLKKGRSYSPNMGSSNMDPCIYIYI